MTKAQKDKYWMDCIQQCRISGLSDHAWCHQNGISTSSFYYNIKRLPMKASDVPVPVSKVAAKQEVSLYHPYAYTFLKLQLILYCVTPNSKCHH